MGAGGGIVRAMDARLHDIRRCTRKHEVFPTSFSDFELGPGASVPVWMAVEAPGWAPYCVDVERREMLLLEIPPEADLSEAPFVYAMQARLARRALFVPFVSLPELAAAMPGPARTILVFSIGRCGSTPVSAALNGADGVWSLSEPDVFFDLVMRRHLLDPAEVPGLVEACTRLSFRPPASRQVDSLAIKFRSASLFQADGFHAALPDAAYVFLYRDGMSWSRSFWNFLRKAGIPQVLDGEMLRFHWRILTAGTDLAPLRPWLGPDGTIPVELTLPPAWRHYVETYLSLLEAGVPFLAIGYDALQSDGEATVASLLRHCGLPAEAGAVMAAFGRDSQAGTAIAREDSNAAPLPETWRRSSARCWRGIPASPRRARSCPITAGHGEPVRTVAILEGQSPVATAHAVAIIGWVGAG
jgi:hypothetical protein